MQQFAGAQDYAPAHDSRNFWSRVSLRRAMTERIDEDSHVGELIVLRQGRARKGLVLADHFVELQCVGAIKLHPTFG